LKRCANGNADKKHRNAAGTEGVKLAKEKERKNHETHCVFNMYWKSRAGADGTGFSKSQIDTWISKGWYANSTRRVSQRW
jgi:hypothetical protein